MIVVDSSVWIANLRRQESGAVQKLKAIDDLDLIIVGDLVLLEVLRGSIDEGHARKVEGMLRCFKVETMLDPMAAVEAASNYRQLRRAGITVRKTVDIMIATFCLNRGYELLHQDRDYDLMARHLSLRII